ncbi:restriction endonuclease subunit S [Phocaeicola plebeius]|uniref:restriction endonuclease subunit S n=1 Tax=Phocaeicola plebeius TaxID=310297 RepID=UPI0026F03FE9|nr:restriction endonuclease subunit S [Phocaeicola plebeius]
MSKLQELIKELCPDGVEFKKLEEVCEIFSGKNKQKKEQGKYPVYGSTGIIAYCDNYQYDKEQLLIARVGANAGFIHIANGKYDVSDNTLIVDVIGTCNSIYIYYVLVNSNINRYSKGGGQPLVTASDIKKIEIPLPPLEIQNEIVRILDTFTSHTAELQAELQARKEQYEYYRNKLLTFDENDERVKWMTLGEVSVNVCSGGTPSTSNKKYYQGHIPWLRTQEVDWKDVFYTKIKISEDAIKNSSAKIIPPNCVIVAMYGATAGKTCINKIPLTTNQACCNLEINKDIALYKYVYYWLYKEYYKLKALGEGSQSNISGKKIKSYAIPIPPLSEQQRIVSILDKFESLVNDLSEGLPAEITVVQEQYEYYRNKLLTFKRKS